MMERLEGVLQHYDWGDPAFIAGMQSRAASGQPEAELWFGAHPSAPSVLADCGGSGLDEFIAADPIAMLGAAVTERFGQLPFLAKILAATKPLSLQTHPSTAQARDGFDRENARGVALDSAERIYRDSNHKPEVLCALTPFEAMVGFRSLAATRELFGGLASDNLRPLVDRLGQSGADADVLADVLGWLVRLEPTTAAELVDATTEAARRAPAKGPFGDELEWTAELARAYPGQVGVVVALLLNHVRLEPSDAVFLGSGNLHMYLRGAGVEVMANSDNVIRGGLTSKHVDIGELLRVVDCSPIAPQVQSADGRAHTYDTPVPEFSLTRVEGEISAVPVASPEVIIVTEGAAILETPGSAAVEASAGEAIWVSADHGSYAIQGTATLFRVTVSGA